MSKMPWKEFLRIWVHVAIHSFGGPAGQIAVIHQEVVDKRQLITEDKFLRALNFCMLLPGPEAQQLATYLGWQLRGWRGGLLAGGLFILPGFLSIYALSLLYVFGENVWWITGFFYGLKMAVMAIVAAALIKISKKALHGRLAWVLALTAFALLFFTATPFPVVVLGAGAVGALQYYFAPHATEAHSVSKPRFSQTLITMSIWLAVWLVPLLLLVLTFGHAHSLTQLAIFFSKMSTVTFGGAYAALSYMGQQVVEQFHWLTAPEMLDGLGMAETTPGPLIQVVQFVGFLASFRFPGELSPLFAATLGSVVATWMTFAPCFLWIFTFAPYIEYLHSLAPLQAALKAITASVVGVIAQLALWFALQVILPESELDYAALLITLVAFTMQFILKTRFVFTLVACGALGVLAMLI